MSKLFTFIRTFWKSISSFSYYKEVVAARFAFSFKYFLLFSFLLGTILTVSISTVVIPTVGNFINRLSKRIYDLYPPNLIVTLKNGEVTTNAAEPIRVPIPFELFTDVPPAVSDQKQTYLVTLDTKAQLADFQTSQSLLFVTKDTLVMQDNNGGYRVYPLKDTADFTLDKSKIDAFLRQITPLFKYVPLLLVSLFFFMFVVILPISRLVSLVFLTVPLLIAAQLLKVSLSYKKLYQLGLHGLTLPALIQISMSVFGLNSPIPFFNSLLYLLYGLIILAALKEKNPPLSPSQLS